MWNMIVATRRNGRLGRQGLGGGGMASLLVLRAIKSLDAGCRRRSMGGSRAECRTES